MRNTLRFRSLSPLLLALALLPHSVAGELKLRSGTIAGPADYAGLPPRLRLPAEALEQAGPVLLRFHTDPTPESRAAIKSVGVRLARYVGNGGFIAWLPKGGLEQMSGLGELDWVAPLHPGLRLSTASSSVPADDPRTRVPLSLHLFAHIDPTNLVARLETLGIPVAGVQGGREEIPGGAYRPGRIVLLPSPARWAAVRERIAAWPEIYWIDRRPAWRLLNDASAWVGQSGLDGGQTTPIHDHGILGEGQTVGVLDTGLDADMCYFRDDILGLPPTNLGLGYAAPDPAQRKVSIVNFLWASDLPANSGDWDSQDHGTHVAGSVAGDDLASPGTRDAGDGMAPAARLVIQDGGYGVDDCADMPALGCPAADLYPFFEQAYDQDARIHTNSYGDRENLTPYNIYSEGSLAADTFMWDHPDMLLVFAAGNNGSGVDTVASPATAKNVLAVGATGHGASAGSIASFSSRGWTHDGRIKPDVTAPGSAVISADNDNNINSENCGTKSSSGTSMAAPTAAGLAALVREYYDKGYYPGGTANPVDAIVPSAALLKATLIASATPMENLATPPPAMEQGWGRLLLDDALYFPGDLSRLFATDRPAAFSASTDPVESWPLQVLDSSSPLRVVLAWTDYPSSVVATTNLVNDLDLELHSPSGDLYRGNVFSAGASITGGSADDVNNVEAVRIENPEAGSWTVRVIPRSIPQAAQGYALVATGRLPAAGVQLERSALTIDDSVGGNGDGRLEPGEWADLPLTLFNSGDTLAAGVSVTAESLTPGVEIRQAQAFFPDLAAGAQIAGIAPYLQIRLSVAHPCTAPLGLRLTYNATGFQRGEELELSTGHRFLIVEDDLEGATGWKHVAAESTANSGDWLVADPDATDFQPGDDVSPDPGLRCLFTAWNFGGAGSDDVDGGVVVARSGPYDLTGHPEARVSLHRWFANRDLGEDSGDFFRLEIRADSTAPDQLLELLGTDQSAPRWTEVQFRVADLVAPGPLVELKVSAADGPSAANIIEAAIDDVAFWDPQCEIHNPTPLPVDSLIVERDGADLALRWDRPVVDPAHGEADRYAVHRSASASGSWTLLDQIQETDPQIVFVDAGVASGPGILYYQAIAGNDAGDAENLP